MNKLRVGLIGCGEIAVQKHIPALIKMNDKVEITALYSGREEKAKGVNESFQLDAKVYKNFLELLQDQDIDIVHICTPNNLHASIAIAALDRGKHVLCEKPMAIHSIDAHMMLEAAKRSGKKLTIAYQNRFRRDAMLLKNACDSGMLGEIYVAKAHAVRRRGVPTWGVFTNKELQGGGPLIDIGSHALDLTLWCMNNYEVESVKGVTYSKLRQQNQANMFGPWNPESFDVEDSAIGFIKMRNGATIYLEAAWALNTLDEREAMTTLSGTKGGAEMRLNRSSNQAELVLNSEMYGMLTESKVENVKEEAYLTIKVETEMDRMFGQWVDAILEGTDPVVQPEETLKVTQIIEAIYESSVTGEEVKLKK